MQPRIIATLLVALSTASLMYLASRGLVIAKNFLHQKTEETTRDITEKLLKNLSYSFADLDHDVTPLFCKAGKGSDCVPPFVFFQTKYRAAPKYELTACVIEKAMSTVLAGVMCYLFDPVGFKAANRSVGNDIWQTRFCKGRNEYTQLQDVMALRQNMNLFTVVRDPIDRFLSGFTDKCILDPPKWAGNKCYGCKANITCFVEKQYERMMFYSKGTSTKISFEDVHFSPQTWYCGFRQKFHEFQIVKYGKGEEDLVGEVLALLKKSGVEKKHLDVIKSDMTNSRTPHVTKSSVDRIILEKRIRADPYVMRLLVKMFYYDFVMLGFELPAIPVNGVTK